MGSVGWRTLTGELYLFGGTTIPYGNFYNDVWKYTIDPACALCNTAPVALFNAPNHICPGACIDFNNVSLNATSYLWTFSGGNPATSTDVDPTAICYNSPGTYSVTLIATNVNGSDTLTLNNFITVYPYPAPQGISQSGDTLFANTGANSYQWYYGGNLIPGATEYFYVAIQGGDYNVVATDANGCEVEAAIFDVMTAVSQQASILIAGGLEIFPNPAEEKLQVKCPEFADKNMILKIYNFIGEEVWSENRHVQDVPCITEINVQGLANGMYWLELNSKEKIFRTKFIKSANR